jgi:predicted phosphodiesterase
MITIMQRREFLKTSALASLAASAVSVEALAQPKRNPPKPKAPPPPVSGITPPVLQSVSETGVTVFWTTTSAATGWVEYGETAELGQVARGEIDGLLPYDERVLRVRLTGLKPGRRYHYRVQTAAFDFTHPYSVGRGAAQPSPVYQFKTLNAGAADASFLVWNDTHQNKETLARLVEQLPRYGADFLVWNGDIFNSIMTDDALVAETLHPAGLEYAATRALMFVRGNHDVRGNRARSLGRTLEPRDGKYYHHFRHGPAAFLALDTGEDKPDDHQEYGGLTDFAGYRSEQIPWLKSVIARPEFQAAPFRILFTHIPLRGPGQSADSRSKWEDLLRQARVDLAISGHTHRYAHNEPTSEQPWPLLVGGGPALQAATCIHVVVTNERLDYRIFDLDGRPLGEWQITRPA